MQERYHSDYSFFPFDTLVKLRWIALLGQMSTVLFLHAIGIQMPFTPLMIILGVSFFINLVFYMVSARELALSEKTLPYFLFYDLAQLAVLLYLTGGLFNPFVVFVLGPILISSSFQDSRLLTLTLIAGSMTIAVLYTSPYPLPWWDGGMVLHPFLRFVIAIALWISILFYGIYVFYVHHMKKGLIDRLYGAEKALVHQKQISELGLLAAASTHELGTPLGTIMLAAKDIEEQTTGSLKEDAALIREQAKRCQNILKNLSKNYKESGGFSVPLKNFLLGIVEKYPQHKKIVWEGDFDASILSSFELNMAFGNIIQNALRFARQSVTFKGEWKEGLFQVTIHDDGPGFEPKIMDRLGEILPRNMKNKHLGIGLYIAKNLFTSLGIEVFFKNGDRSTQGHITGACCYISIPNTLVIKKEAV